MRTIENKLRVDRGTWAAEMGLGVMEGLCCDEFWVLYVGVESLNSPETNTALYVSYLKFKIRNGRH